MSAAAQLCFSVKDLLVDSNELNQMAPIQFLQEESEGTLVWKPLNLFDGLVARIRLQCVHM